MNDDDDTPEPLYRGSALVLAGFLWAAISLLVDLIWFSDNGVQWVNDTAPFWSILGIILFTKPDGEKD